MGCTLSSENPDQPNEPRQQMTKGRNVSSPRAAPPGKCCAGTYSQRVDCTQRWAWLDSHEVALGLGIVLKNTFLSSYNLGKDLLWHKSPLFIFFFSVNFLRADACNCLAFNGSEPCCFPLAIVRSHACEVDPYGMPGGCSHICLLSSSYKARTCRCRTGFILGSDGRSCKSMLFKSKSLPAMSSPGCSLVPGVL